MPTKENFSNYGYVNEFSVVQLAIPLFSSAGHMRERCLFLKNLMNGTKNIIGKKKK